ncbi:RNA polymerase sigma-70 factor [Dyadobacter sp. LHD-138]|uniref:RNA polymerase sigma factor n=1 Tax=Dyadobacter sp. LHD-138 TaxID=3071413 RepID=UPI0027E0F820|nr:RNA polymerase sigma-70 factor [Dyadobacter sp. LHD-138]MDQ6477069.1 RNA polymerase sigma-70 factor [Dyadobacter sp. LHD-138]
MQSIFISNELLVERLEQGDEYAFEQIYDRYWHRLYRAALNKIKVPDEAKEIVQDIFLDLWLRHGTVCIGELENYLHRAVKFKVLDFFKKEIVRRNYDKFAFVNMSEVAWDTEEELAYNDLNQLLIACIDLLPPKTRVVFELSKIQHKSNGEVAKMLKISTRSVEYHLSQGLKTLRIQLQDYDIYIFLLLSQYLLSQRL